MLKEVPEPVFDAALQTPSFTVTYARAENAKSTTNFLQSAPWVEELGSVIRGVEMVPVDDELLAKAEEFSVLLEQRLNCHIGDRVDPSR